MLCPRSLQFKIMRVLAPLALLVATASAFMPSTQFAAPTQYRAASKVSIPPQVAFRAVALVMEWLIWVALCV